MEENLNNVMEYIMRLSRYTRRNRNCPNGSKGYTPFFCMKNISKCEGITAGNLASSLHVRPSSLTSMLIKLENDGLIERRKDENDSRAIRVYLTDKGREEIKKEHDQHRSKYDFLADELSAEETEEFCRVAQKIIDICDQREKELRRENKNK